LGYCELKTSQSTSSNPHASVLYDNIMGYYISERSGDGY